MSTQQPKLFTSENGFSLIKYYEGKHTLWSIEPELTSYLCPARYWTIGWGTISYPDGTPVRRGERCSIQQARKWLIHDVRSMERELHEILFENKLTDRINQNQFDSLLDLAYNIGTGENGLGGSTLIKRIATRAPEASIEEAFMMWVKARADNDKKDNDGDGLIDEPGEKKMLLGLKNRRQSEAYLYRYGELKFFTK